MQLVFRKKNGLEPRCWSSMAACRQLYMNILRGILAVQIICCVNSKNEIIVAPNFEAIMAFLIR